MLRMNRKNIQDDQLTSALIQEGINQNERLFVDRLSEIHQIAAEKTQYAHTTLQQSINCIENVRDFVSKPHEILGSMATKHGEIAEQVEVNIRNGKSLLNYIKPTATFDSIGRTAPEDYIIDDFNVQSKFIVGSKGSLEHVIGHLHKYPGFANQGYYHIPKDQHELLVKIANGDNVNNLNERSIGKIKELIEKIENETGKPFFDVVRSGISNYKDVQIGRIDETLDGYEIEFREHSAKDVEKIRKESEAQAKDAQQITDPSWGEALKYGTIAAIISGTASAGIKIYSKIRKGTKITQFTLQDWTEVGFDFVKSGAKGGISGLGIYGLTKLGGFPAPFAGATVSTAVGIASLIKDYKNGNISEVDFGESSCSLSVEAGLSAIGAAIGQTLIPIPVLGAIIGTATIKASLEISKYIIGESEHKLIEKMQKDYESQIAALDAECLKYIHIMDDYFNKLGGFIDAALSKDSAVRFYGSIELCRFFNIPENIIIHNIEDCDRFMLS